MTRAGEPPPGLVPIQLKGSVLLLTPKEFTAAVRRGKWWRRRQRMAERANRQVSRPGPTRDRGTWGDVGSRFPEDEAKTQP